MFTLTLLFAISNLLKNISITAFSNPNFITNVPKDISLKETKTILNDDVIYKTIEANISEDAINGNKTSNNADKDEKGDHHKNHGSSKNYSFPIYPYLELTKNNSVTLRGEIENFMAAKLIFQMSKINSDEIIFYISSPGGSIEAGDTIAQYMNFLRQKGKTITCIADQAASMAFSLFQECDNRYVTSSSILMQHQMSVAIRDQYENLKSYMKLLEAINENSIKREAARINMSVESFNNRIISDWWLYGEQSVEQGVADALCYVGCSEELLRGETVETIRYAGTDYEITYSNCPLIRVPLHFSRKGSKYMSSADIMKIITSISRVLSTKDDVKCYF